MTSKNQVGSNGRLASLWTVLDSYESKISGIGVRLAAIDPANLSEEAQNAYFMAYLDSQRLDDAFKAADSCIEAALVSTVTPAEAEHLSAKLRQKYAVFDRVREFACQSLGIKVGAMVSSSLDDLQRELDRLGALIVRTENALAIATGTAGS